MLKGLGRRLNRDGPFRSNRQSGYAVALHDGPRSSNRDSKSNLVLASRARGHGGHDLIYFLQYAFAYGKMSNHKRVQRETYADVRAMFGLPAQMCPHCGHTRRKNRPQGGLLFRCCRCGLTLHADLIGARKIASRTLLIRQDWTSTGELSGRPDVADEEAKAARLSRYAELRWSPAASPRP
jgi:hypothetical protein